MPEQKCDYLIVGGGLAGASAVEGIRELDPNGSIALIAAEPHLPYDRPPLSKQLWFGKKKLEAVFVHDEAYYDKGGVTLLQGRRVVSLDAQRSEARDDAGTVWRYGKALLATGGVPRRLSIPGGELENVYYYRTLDDYVTVRRIVAQGGSALVVGGGFIGSEMAAALAASKVKVTMIFPQALMLQRVFPPYLARAMQKRYIERGIRIVPEDQLSSITSERGRLKAGTRLGRSIERDFVVAGIGIVPDVALAEQAGLAIQRRDASSADGIIVNEFLQTSVPAVFAAGDNAWWHSPDLGRSLRLEHWDNAKSQGKCAGRNMAGAHEAFTYLPYFFSDLFEFGYEAVGLISGDMETYADWQKENDTGVIYFLRDAKVAGAMMCNVWDKVPAARELIRRGQSAAPEALRGAIA